MFNPDKDDYPLNESGKPEFATIIATVDQVSNNPALGDDVVQKFVLSTQDLIAALTANAVYFGQPHLLAQPGNARLLVEAGRAANPVFVYVTPREGTIQIITGTPTWNMLVQHPDFGDGSMLLTVDKAHSLVAQALGNSAQFAGEVPTLSLLDLSPENISAPAAGEQDPLGSNERAPLSDSASSEGGPGTTAASLRDTADIEQD